MNEILIAISAVLAILLIVISAALGILVYGL